MNRSLYGVVNEALLSNRFDSIFGALYGIDGIIKRDLIDLTKHSKRSWSRISKTPGAALGSTRTKIREEHINDILQTLASYNISHLFTIGGNDSAETAHTLSVQCLSLGHNLTVINIPKTIDNDLVGTDHAPGYGSAARFIALATMGAGFDAEAMRNTAPITIIEVMGRDTGWLAASSILAKREEREAPHVVAVPEIPLREEVFLSQIENAYSRFGFAVAVVAENTRGPNGVLGSQLEPSHIDDFGHPYYDGPAQYLAGLVSQRLRVRARHEKPGTIQRSMMSSISSVDAEEAELAGRSAVQLALAHHNDEMVALVRDCDEAYSIHMEGVPLSKIAGRVKTMPEQYLDMTGCFVKPEFIEYVRPLVGKLPETGRLH